MKKITRIILFAFASLCCASAALTPIDLRCDYATNPMGVDSNPLRLFWKLESSERGTRQAAYEILVSSSPELLAKNEGDLWGSGKVNSDETIQINYGGKELDSWRKVFWKVRVWDANGNASAWSRPASWVMGVLNNFDWHAYWIGAEDTDISSLLLRKEFTIKPGLVRAMVNVCGLGQYEMTLNGKKVGDDFLSPGWSKYDKTCLYDTCDITDLLRHGDNVIGLELGNGMYQELGWGRYTKFKNSFGPQKAIAQIRLEYADGSVQFIGTDESWQVAPGPITFSSIYGGEGYDARLEQRDWNQSGFDATKWQHAIIVNGPGGELRGLSCSAPPIREFETHEPVFSYTLTNGDIVFDLSQNAAHIFKISVSGEIGSQFLLFPSELTNKDGSITQGSMGSGKRGNVWCNFTKGSNGTETWSPKFFYVGCRYVQVHCVSASTNGVPPKVKSLVGIVIHSTSEPVGEFECSNDLFNRTFRLVHWAQQNNMVSLLTDCPHRERLGWLEQDHLNGPALRYDFDLAQLFTKTLNDIADSQLTNGLVPSTAPEYAVFRNKEDSHHLRNIFGDTPEWSSSFMLIPWQQYEFDGDLNLFRIHYAAMTNYLSYLGGQTTNYIVSGGLGDWYDLGPKKPGLSQLTPISLTATAYYYKDAAILSRVAGLLGNEEDQQKYSNLAQNIRNAFNAEFYDATNGWYGTDSQCANAISLVMGLCEETNHLTVLKSIVDDVRARGNGLTAGDVGYYYLLRALAEGSRSDVIFDMNNQTNKPGYGMQIAKGKTSLTEAWDGGSSQDHFMLGQIQEWFYRDLAGIQDAPESPGFKKIIIAPQPVGDVTWVKGSFDSIRGKIVSNWQRDSGKFILKISIPANTTAEVYVPAKSLETVTENGGPAGQSPDVKFLRFENDRAVYAVESGKYDFHSEF